MVLRSTGTPQTPSAPDRSASAASRHDEGRGLLLGLAGVVMFALTLPMTRLAVGNASEPQLPPAFVTVGRAALAGLLSVAWLAWVRAPWPARAQLLRSTPCRTTV